MKGIIFSTPMVQAILAGRKTQTRRIIKVQPKDNQLWVMSQTIDNADRKNFGKLQWALPNGSYSGGDNRYFSWPYKVGDVLYVKETYAPALGEYAYKADYSDFVLSKPENKGIWKSPMFMPEKAARLFIVITGWKAERLQDINEEDAIAEGVERCKHYPKVDGWKDYSKEKGWHHSSPTSSFKSLWESIHGKESWNPDLMVWAYTFEIYEP